MNINLTEQEVGLILAGLGQLERNAQLRGNATTAFQAGKLYENINRQSSQLVVTQDTVRW